jgi:hypothetical protein
MKNSSESQFYRSDYSLQIRGLERTIILAPTGLLLSTGWKNKDPSLVFVGFGTEYKMPVEQVHELAYGLELSKLPFLWILRNPKGLSSSELLPGQFMDQICDRGMVSLSWAPQVRLKHTYLGSLSC